jgi:hypothetical protein
MIIGDDMAVAVPDEAGSALNAGLPGLGRSNRTGDLHHGRRVVTEDRYRGALKIGKLCPWTDWP